MGGIFAAPNRGNMVFWRERICNATPLISVKIPNLSGREGGGHFDAIGEGNVSLVPPPEFIIGYNTNVIIFVMLQTTIFEICRVSSDIIIQ